MKKEQNFLMQEKEVMKGDGKVINMHRRQIATRSLPDRYPIIIRSPPNRHPIANQSQEEIILEENKQEDNISPSPPLKGGGRKKKNETKEINSKARFLFEEYFKKTFSNSYYWTAKDAGAMSQLLQKLTFSRTQKKMPVDDDSVLYALQILLSSIKEGWIFENFSVTNINSKYNEIISQARKEKPSLKADIGIILKNNSPDKYDNDSEKWNR